MKIDFYPAEKKQKKQLKYVIIFTRYQLNKWIFVKHKQRSTWELPAGHIEKGEKPEDAAKRELYEETGAVCYTISPLFDYSIKINRNKVYGRIFLADVEKFDSLPQSEIGEITLQQSLPDKLTYPEIQTLFFEKVLSKLKEPPQKYYSK